MLARFVLAIALAAAGAAHAEGEPWTPPDHADLETEIVGITSERLVPEVKHVESSEAFGWINHSSRRVSIRFDAEVARRMRCTSLTPFRVSDGRLVAPAIGSGEIATLCRLAPGEYPYVVEPEGSETPLNGRLVVGR